MTSRRKQSKKRKLDEIVEDAHRIVDEASPLDRVICDAWAKTTSAVHEVSFKWTIENFSTYVDSNTNDQSSITSPRFSPSTCKDLKFGLDIYPKGDDKDCRDFVSIYIFLTSSQAQHRVQLWLSFMKANGEKFIMRYGRIKLRNSEEDEDGWGWGKFISHLELFDDANNIVPEDKLTILCRVIAYSEDYGVTGSSPNDITQANLIAQNSLTADFGNLLDSPNPRVQSDVVFRFKSSTKILPAHKLILMARSPVFSRMFQHKMTENNENRVYIEDIEEDVFVQMVQFIYTGKVADDKLTIDLLIAADKYQIESLKAICAVYLSKTLTVESVSSTLLWSELHNSDHLKNQCIEFIVNNCPKVIKTKSWDGIVSSRQELALDIFHKFALKSAQTPPDQSDSLQKS